MARRGRPSEGLTEEFHVRAQPDEAQMRRDIAAQLGLSLNSATRWALRYAWQHASATTDHSTCPGHSPCAAATRGLTAGRQRPAGRATEDSGQLTITHEATVRNHGTEPGPRSDPEHS